MRILFVLNSLGAGGTERSTAVLLPELRARGVDVRVATLKRASEGDEESVRAAGFAVHVLSGASRIGQVRELRQLVREWRPAVVHTAIFDADVVGRLACAGTHVPVISSLVNTSYDAARFADPRVSAWRLRAVQAVDAVTARHLTDHFHAVSDGVVGANVAALGIDRHKVTVVERGRDWTSFGRPSPERRDAVRAALGVPRDAFVVVTVGRHEFQKAQADLVDAVGQVRRALPDVALVIAGREGNATGDLRHAIELHALAEAVHVLGHRDDVADILAAADVFALPSVYEGTAGAALEALAMEVPVVATRVRGVAGVLEHDRNALLVPASRPAELAAAILRLSRDPALAARLRAEGRRDIEERFTLRRCAERTIAMYEAVSARR